MTNPTLVKTGQLREPKMGMKKRTTLQRIITRKKIRNWSRSILMKSTVRSYLT